jgi:hypothetical protein
MEDEQALRKLTMQKYREDLDSQLALQQQRLQAEMEENKRYRDHARKQELAI